ncbi:tetratricopeptide (TPR) repeat protein [Rhodanobacter sp. ANJX3]|uniref:tetratricopeptide repeat protein n=1 Tax=Rhodanobacter sp. ANJX3 TaxID=2723083 RepID=UPI00185B91EA|nr:tetratricopeptide repeat protein [Rhodanobacter sp. ANJX3]MBB5360680.1 tetratricopeptide (TPR) repeat protein [Rhodanobacter sp. ANJX3]
MMKQSDWFQPGPLIRSAVLIGTLLLTWLAYVPGLHGGFLFDDFANLPALGSYGSIRTWTVFWRYITSGIADPTGRPLTLLSFLLDARDWPADPFPFKRTNLILHLFNGVLLYLLLIRLGRLITSDTTRCHIGATFGAAIWLLHPLLVSTTLYIVQREAMLPATCVLIGLLLWLRGREGLICGRLKSGSLWVVLGLGGFTLLGTLAKANGVLLPLYALLIEIIVLAPRQPLGRGSRRSIYRTLLVLLGWIPTATVVGYLLWVGLHGIAAGAPMSRPWTYGERMLTEPRVLMDYLRLLWLPHPFSSGVFNDQYSASTSLLHPITTLFSLLAIAALIVAAWRWRRRYPALSLGVLFYFGGQLLESTSIALELYFEHRNYVPALLMFWPLGLWLGDMRTLKAPKRFLLIALPLSLALMTYLRAEVWGDVQTQALVWARMNPDSARAQANAAQIEMAQGRPQEAIERLLKSMVSQPEQSQLVFNLIGARCMTGGIDGADLAAARAVMASTANPGGLFVNWFGRMLPVVVEGGCPGLTAAHLSGLIDAGLANPGLSQSGPRQDLVYLRGRIALAQHQPNTALADFERALDLQVRPGLALEAAATLGAAGYPGQGLQMLDHYKTVQNRAESPGPGMPMVHEWVLSRQHYWQDELARLRHQLFIDANADSANTVGYSTVQGTR